MHRLLKREQVLTIPNLLSLIRLLMIPAIIWLYCEKNNYYAAAGMVFLSGLTDIADGMILLCAAVLLLSMVKYLTFHCRLLRSKEK